MTHRLKGTVALVNGEVIHGDGGQHVAGAVLSPGKFG